MDVSTSIADRYRRLRDEVGDEVTIVLAAKKRTPEEIAAAIEAGATDIGENYVQEGEAMQAALGENADRLRWHMIGHLQKNKINKAIPVFDVIQTIDSLAAAEAISSRVRNAGKTCMPVMLEINIGNEDSKAGIRPEDHEPFEQYMERLVRDIAALDGVRVEGLMTMGPRFGDPEPSRPFFRRTRELFARLKDAAIRNVEMKYLSMGMSNSYRIAIEEGSNMIRPGTSVFGPRPDAGE